MWCKQLCTTEKGVSSCFKSGTESGNLELWLYDLIKPMHAQQLSARNKQTLPIASARAYRFMIKIYLVKKDKEKKQKLTKCLFLFVIQQSIHLPVPEGDVFRAMIPFPMLNARALLENARWLRWWTIPSWPHAGLSRAATVVNSMHS